MKIWIFLQNPFLNATKNSYKGMKDICNFTDAALYAQLSIPFFAALYAVLHPLVVAYNAAFDLWESQGGTQKSQTSTLTELLARLSSPLIRQWDIFIQGFYEAGSERYIQLLPHRRVPFQKGSQQDRISAVNALIIAIGSDADLATLKTEIQAFYTELTAANTTQKGSKVTTNVDSSAVEAARIAVGVALEGVLGLLLDHFKSNPLLAGDFFDQETIRNPIQTVYEHNINGGETRFVAKRTLHADDPVRLINTGNTDLKFYFAKEKNDPLGDVFVTVTANDEITVNASVLGDVTLNHFLKCTNTDATEQGSFTVEL